MANCKECGSLMGDDALACEQCGHRVELAEAAAVAPPPPYAPPAPTMKSRPTGGTAIALGWVCIGIGILCAVVAVSKLGAYRPYGLGMEVAFGSGVAGLWLTAAGGVFGNGVFLLVVGYVLRAIWFLPGPDMKAVN